MLGESMQTLMSLVLGDELYKMLFSSFKTLGKNMFFWFLISKCDGVACGTN